MFEKIFPRSVKMPGSLSSPVLPVLFAFLIALTSSAAAETFYVSKTGNEPNWNGCRVKTNPCLTIGYALGAANDGDVIEVGAGTFMENLVIEKDISIIGAPGTTIDGNGNITKQRVILLTNQKTLNLRGLTITNGSINPAVPSDRGGAGLLINQLCTANLRETNVTNNHVPCYYSDCIGGGILNRGTLNIWDSIVSDNSANGDGGGGIFNTGGANLSIDTTVIRNNLALHGGGIVNYGQTLSLTNVSLQGNTATNFEGGGLVSYASVLTLKNSTVYLNKGYRSGGVAVVGGTAVLTNVTLSGNQATQGYGGGIKLSGGLMNVNNSTVAENAGLTNTGGIAVFLGTLNLSNTILYNSSGNCHRSGGTFASRGYNLSSDGSCSAFFNQPGDLNNTQPIMGPLGSYGGPTYTYPIFPASPAVDGGNPVHPGSGGFACAATDQRGVTRPQGDRCDIGAFEAGILYLPLILKE